LIDANEKVMGRALFTSDIELPGMLHATILRSPYAHAKVLHVDTGQAERLAGVKAVLSKNNAPRAKIPATLGGPKERVAFEEKVRYVGDEVAAVAAINKEVAEEALRLIKVDYEELPAIFDPEETIKPSATLIHEDKEGNIATSIEVSFGDVGAGFREADFIYEETFRTPSQRHASMETHAAIASFDVAGKLTVWSSTQLPFHIQRILAEYIDIPMSKVRVIKPYLGGGFGSKLHMVVEHISALLSRMTARPVKLVLNREEEFSASVTRHAFVIGLKIGVKKDGTLTAIEARALANVGAYMYVTGPLRIAGDGLIRTYRCPNLKYQGHSVYTNLSPAGGFRGYGNTQAHFAIESMMDIIAEKLEIDPIEFRLKNYKKAGDIGLGNTLISSSGLEECLAMGAEKTDWGVREKISEKNGLKKRGIGVACLAHRSGTRFGLPDYSSAFIKLNEDGTAHLLTGAADLGTGSTTTLAQIAAEELGLNLDAINVVAGDTDTTPFDRGAFASATLYVSGGAVRAAAADVKQQLLSYVAKKLNMTPEDFEIRMGRIYIKRAPDKWLNISAVVKEASEAKDGARAFLGKASFENPSGAHSFGAQFAEVEVDTETGQVEVLRMVAIHDIGKAINPMVVEGQIEGALQQGIGYALTENIVVDEKKGKMLNADFANYMVLTALDMPKVEIGLSEPIDPTGPFGAKGIGEPSTLGVAPAIANAIYNAIGIRFTEIPITPEKVFIALTSKKGRPYQDGDGFK
jgi:xanthine dehydrogenase molybdenum-binding subunit